MSILRDCEISSRSTAFCNTNAKVARTGYWIRLGVEFENGIKQKAFLEWIFFRDPNRTRRG